MPQNPKLIYPRYFSVLANSRIYAYASFNCDNITDHILHTQFLITLHRKANIYTYTQAHTPARPLAHTKQIPNLFPIKSAY